MSASVVIGQQNFTSGTANQGGSVAANTVSTPVSTLIVGGKLLVADFGNHRVLIYNSVPTQNNASANLEIGQVDLNSNGINQGGSAGANTLRNPAFLASNGQNLVISDASNNRVLIFNNIPTINNASADVVVGQTGFTGVGTGTSTSTLNTPRGVVISDSKLIVADEQNSRILIWNSIPTSNGAAADVSLSKASASSNLNQPYQISVYNGKLMAADRASNRVLIWNSIPTTDDTLPDVVVGQPDFSTTSTTPIDAAKFNGPRGVYADGDRLYVNDRNNNRLLIYNSIPTSNGASADLVIGQSNFSSGTANGGGSAASNVLSGNFGVYFYNNQLFVSEISNHRITVFNNVIATPELNIDTPLSQLLSERLRVNGNVQLGERGTYALQWVKADVNGGGLGYVTSLGGGRDNGSNLTLYDFFHDFTPYVNGGDMNNYTLKLVASSFNADSTSLFYFLPFNFNYIRKTTDSKNLNISFTVNKNQAQRVKDNIDHFEVMTSTDSGKMWKKLTTNISNEKIDTTTGQIYLTIPNTLLPGTKYLVKVNSISRNSNWEQSSNTLIYFVPKRKTK